mgnify:FL=1
MKISPRRTQLCVDQHGDHPLLFHTAANEAGIEPEGGAGRRQGLSRTGMLEPPLAPFWRSRTALTTIVSIQSQADRKDCTRWRECADEAAALMQSSSVCKLSSLRRGFRTYFLIPKRRREGIIAKEAVSPGVHKAKASLLWSTGWQNFSSNLLPREWSSPSWSLLPSTIDLTKRSRRLAGWPRLRTSTARSSSARGAAHCSTCLAMRISSSAMAAVRSRMRPVRRTLPCFALVCASPQY